MDYLVVAPHTPFFQWQIALLVQSFRVLGMEENLAVLLVAGIEEPVQSHFCTMFANHARLKAVRLPTDSDPDLIRLHGLSHAIKTGFVSQRFVNLPPYCMLRHPILPPQANVTFTCQPDFTYNHIDSFGISSAAVSKRMQDKKQWLPVGDVFIFDNMTTEFFDLAASRGEMIAFDSYRDLLKAGKDSAPKALFRAAMSMTLMEAFGRLKVDTSRRLECKMIEHDQQSCVINYYYGCPPNFSRCFYPMDGKGVSFSDHPFSAIQRTPDSFASLYMKQVIQMFNDQQA